MYLLPTSPVRLPSMIAFLVSLTSVLLLAQPISSLQPNKQPISSLLPNKQSISNLHTSIQKRASDFESLSLRELLVSLIMRDLNSGAASVPTIMPTAKHTATVIFLHELGDVGSSWISGFTSIKQPHIKYMFPNAPMAKVTLNFGMVMPSWFNIYSFTKSGVKDERGIDNSAKIVLHLVEEERKQGIPADRIVIGGFGQGGAIALYTALTFDRPYAGVIALSTWLPFPHKFEAEGTVKKDLPILQCHGKEDTTINYMMGLMTHEFLEKLVHSPKFNTYLGLGHDLSAQEFVDMHDFINTVLPA